MYGIQMGDEDQGSSYDNDPVLQAALRKLVRLEKQVAAQKIQIQTYRADIERLRNENIQLMREISYIVKGSNH